MVAPLDAAERQRIITDVLTRVATGQLAGVVLEANGLSRQTWSEWCRADRALSDEYARAREEQAHALAEEALRIADGGDALSLFYGLCVDRWEEDQLELAVSKADRARIEQVANGMRSQVVQRDKMRLDARKWLTSKIAPKLYGDKLDLTSGGEKLASAVIALPAEELPAAMVSPVDAAERGQVSGSVS